MPQRMKRFLVQQAFFVYQLVPAQNVTIFLRMNERGDALAAVRIPRHLYFYAQLLQPLLDVSELRLSMRHLAGG